MTKKLVLCLVATAACAGGKRDPESAKALEAERAREAEQSRETARELERAMRAENAKNRDSVRQLEQKIDELNRKLDTLIAKGGVPPRPPRPEPDRTKTYAVPIDGNPFDGPANAKVTLVRAYDYACGFCEKSRPTMDELRKKYGKDLRIVYKHLVIHPKNATVGALAFCAAGKQGKHLEMDRLIWEKGFKARQLDLTDVPLPSADPANPTPPTVKCWDHPDGCQNVYGYAAELGLKMDRFKADLKGDCTTVVANDGYQLSKFSVSSTPAFFVNGRYVSGAQPVETFSVVIDEELKLANERIAAGTPAASYYKKWVMEKGLPSLTP